MPIRLRDAPEQQLLDRVRQALEPIDPQACRQIEGTEKNLDRLSAVLDDYPSILDERTLGCEVYSLDTLIESLYRDGCNHTVLLPTKVIVGRAFTVAKLNLYGFLVKVAGGHHQLALFREELQKQWETCIFSLLIEDVYQVIVERDGCYSASVRRRAAISLIHLWEHRFDRTLINYAPTVIDLWRVRRRVAPVFGTMLGTRELVKLSALLSDRWHRFLIERGDDQEVLQALQEFVFGLLHEDITLINRTMQLQNISVINRDDLIEKLGEQIRPVEVDSSDPREMYRFYQRRSSCIKRRALANQPGPRRTLEELLLAYLIDKDQTATPEA